LARPAWAQDDPVLHQRMQMRAMEIVMRSKVRVDQEKFRSLRASSLPVIAQRIKEAAKANPRLLSNPDALIDL
jgi:hypothetical protein